jgi:hypothetical protein
MKIFSIEDRERFKINKNWLDYLENEFEKDYDLNNFNSWTLGIVVVIQMIEQDKAKRYKNLNYIPDGAFVTIFVRYLIEKHIDYVSQNI